MSKFAEDWGDDCLWCKEEHLPYRRSPDHGQAVSNKKTPATGWVCVCSRYFIYLDEWHDHLVGREGVRNLDD